MGAVISLHKKMYLSLYVSFINITTWFSGAKAPIQNKASTLSNIIPVFCLFIFHGIKNVFSFKNKKKPPKPFKLVKSQNYKMI